LSAIGGPRASQRAVGDRDVVGDEIALGVARSGEEDLARVADRDLLPEISTIRVRGMAER